MRWTAAVRDMDWLKARVTADPATGCWEWNLHRHAVGGYGEYGITVRGQPKVTLRAHRLALELALGRKLDPGMLACHRCDNPPCCNPDHLYEGTKTDNARDMLERERGGNTKLSLDDVRVIQGELERGVTGRALAKRFGVAPYAISRIRTRQTLLTRLASPSD